MISAIGKLCYCATFGHIFRITEELNCHPVYLGENDNFNSELMLSFTPFSLKYFAYFRMHVGWGTSISPHCNCGAVEKMDLINCNFTTGVYPTYSPFVKKPTNLEMYANRKLSFPSFSLHFQVKNHKDQYFAYTQSSDHRSITIITQRISQVRKAWCLRRRRFNVGLFNHKKKLRK